LKYGTERMADVINEIKPLLEAHYKEIAKYQDIPLMPEWEIYEKMDEIGVMKIFTCRHNDNNELIGYAIFFVKNHIHYKTCKTAMQDILFISPEYRGKGMKFIMWCDDRLKEIGVQVVFHHVKETHNFGPMLERIGYELMDRIYTRRLDGC
jgi:GNAT superfamily N-acetyltransferase